MRYLVKYLAKCYNCSARDKSESDETVIADDTIQADNQTQAAEKFKEKHKLCSKCLADGAKAAVSFPDVPLSVEQISA